MEMEREQVPEHSEQSRHDYDPGLKLRVVLLPLADALVYLPLASLMQVMKKTALPPAPLFDLQSMLSLPPGHHGSHSRILLLKAGERRFALQVEDILQVADLERASLQPLQTSLLPPALQQAAAASLVDTMAVFEEKPVFGLNLPVLAGILPADPAGL